MSKEKCWVFVDKDGTEKISNSRPIRRQFKGKRIMYAMWGLCTGTYTFAIWICFKNHGQKAAYGAGKRSV